MRLWLGACAPAQHFDTTQERTDKLLSKASKLSVPNLPEAQTTLEGEKSGGDEFGNTWTETWLDDAASKTRSGTKSGADSMGGTAVPARA